MLALSTLLALALVVVALFARQRHLSRVPVPKDRDALKQRRDVLRALESMKKE